MGNGPLAQALPALLGQSGAAPAAGGGAPAATPFRLDMATAPRTPADPVPPKDQTRLLNLDIAGQAPERNPMRSATNGGSFAPAAPAVDPNQPIPVKTQRIDPATGGMFAEAMSTPRGQASAVPPRQAPPREGSFDAKPWAPPETVQGGQWPPKRDIVADVAANSNASTASRMPGMFAGAGGEGVPAPEQNPNFHTPPKPPMPFSEQQFDTTAPITKPGKGGMFDFLKGPIGGAQAYLKGVPTNPMAQMGLSLLSSGYDGSNPYAAVQKSLGTVPGMEHMQQSSAIAAADAATKKKTAADAAKDEEMARLINQLMLQQSQGDQPGAATRTLQEPKGAARYIK